jgi:hypothetical protein
MNNIITNTNFANDFIEYYFMLDVAINEYYVISKDFKSKEHFCQKGKKQRAFISNLTYMCYEKLLGRQTQSTILKSNDVNLWLTCYSQKNI